MEKFSRLKMACILVVVFAATAIASPAQTLTVLHSFHGPDGANPNAGLVQATDGSLYGTTGGGGANSDPFLCPSGCGTIFKITPEGKLTTLYNFCAETGCTDGYLPGGLVQATDGNLYGTTFYGGPSAYGTVFRITLAGTLTTLYSSGADPNGLIQGADGNFYGTTANGGTGTKCACGTVFKITTSGTLTTLHSFDGPDGATPNGLVQAVNGNFYGTTQLGGASRNCFERCGTIFGITPAGEMAVLHSFDGTDGTLPMAGLVAANDGNLYGTTFSGGAYTYYGTVFKTTLGGTLTTLHSFDGTDGRDLFAGLIQATDGNLYGPTANGGTECGGAGCGTLFEITPGGALTTLYSFCAETDCTDGEGPQATLVQATDGNFYGTTIVGGAKGFGTVFKLSVGLGPFVETLPTSGAVGTPVIILGSNLTGATRVGFNGTPTTFTVVSSSEITTTLPAGANSGSVTVLTPSGLLKSSVMFRVTP